MRRGRLLIGLVIAVISLLSYYGVSQKNPITGETQHIALTRDQEIALGLESAPEMAAEFGGLDPDESVQADVAAVGKRVVEQSDAAGTQYEFSFHVLADPETVNAFALPGGPVFITRGLLKRLENEAQLAGVLGHETGHVIARHSAAQIAKSRLAQGLVTAAGAAGSDDGSGGQHAAQVAAVVAQMVQLRYGRGDEIQADTLGVRLMSEAGYDPRALIDVMRILESSGGAERPPEFMSSHPDPGNRRGVIQRAIETRFPSGVPENLTLGRSIKMPS
ncbi:MAG TPA: M48 family metalloprotease [Candidatus Polarisedimenticolia bacterium]|nr:M48 family metalloprotease [Candidatus Polarisedimenticolia bacterium]